MIHVKASYKLMSSEQVDKMADAIADMIICYVQNRRIRERESKEESSKDRRPEFVFKFLNRFQFEERTKQEASEKSGKRKPVIYDAFGREIIEVYREFRK